MKYLFKFVFSGQMYFETEISFPSNGCEMPSDLINKISAFKFVTFETQSINLSNVNIIEFKEVATQKDIA